MQHLDTLSALKTLLNAQKIQPCMQGTLKIEEKDRQASMRSVEIASVGASAFAIRHDECGFPGQVLFANAHDLHKTCDSVAFCVVEDKAFILCCELKSSLPTRHEVTQKFRAAHCLLSFLGTLLGHYCPSHCIDNWERRYFVFHNQGNLPLSKRAFRDEFNNTQPDNARFIATNTGSKHYLRQLLGIPL